MPHPLPTVTIETDNGPVRINERDYDPKEHKIVKEGAPTKKKSAKKKPAKKATPAVLPEGSIVTEREGRHYVTDKDGKDVVSELVNAEGYETSAEAWAIVMPTTA